MTKRLVVVGGVAAGMSAASRAKRLNPDLHVTVLEQGNFIAYGACSLPYFVAGNFDDYRLLIARTPEEAAQQGIDVRTGHRVEAVDPAAGVVTVTAAGEGRQKIPFDYLVLATGARPVAPAAWGVDTTSGVFVLRTIEDALALRQRLEELGSGARAVVIGGGYIGVEVADAMLARGVVPALVDLAPQVLTNFDADMAAHVEQDLREAGVDLYLGDGVEGLETAGGRLTGVRLASGRLLPADVAVVALGVRPRAELARAAGIAIGETGAIAVDSQQRTNFPYIFAAGDCCQSFHLVTGRPAYVPLGTTANKQGRVAGTVIGGGQAYFAGIVGTAVLKAHRVSVARTGLTLAQAADIGLDVASVTITAPDRVRSYPGASDLVVKLVGEKGTGRLLGAQIAGREPMAVSGRIDVIATALFNRMTVEDLPQLDLSYAPPFAPVWDPLLVAANVLQRRL